MVPPNDYESFICFDRTVVITYYLVAPDFKNKTRYTSYVSPESQISHIVTNKGNIKT
jgi:hypothetical protein